MAGAFDAGAALFIAVAVSGAVLAAIVLAAGPDRLLNRLLSLFLALFSFNYATDALSRVVTSDLLAYNLWFVTYVTWSATALAYLAFVGVALDTPLVRPLRTPLSRLGLAGLALVVLVTGWIETSGAQGAARRPDGVWIIPGLEPYAEVTGVLIGLVFAFGLVASLDALRRAPRGSVSRKRAGLYALAFGIHDAALAFASLGAAFLGPAGWYFIVWAVPSLAFFLLLAVALLRHQLFDFDLKLKWTLRRGTLVSIFLAAFFVAVALAEQWLQQHGTLVGGIAVGLLLFALRPLERAAERVANVAMPTVQDTEEYRTVRKREVYRAAVEGALEDGAISDKERDVLARVADQLGLSVAQTLEIEREAGAASARAA